MQNTKTAVSKFIAFLAIALSISNVSSLYDIHIEYQRTTAIVSLQNELGVTCTPGDSESAVLEFTNIASMDTTMDKWTTQVLLTNLKRCETYEFILNGTLCDQAFINERRTLQLSPGGVPGAIINPRWSNRARYCVFEWDVQNRVYFNKVHVELLNGSDVLVANFTKSTSRSEVKILRTDFEKLRITVENQCGTSPPMTAQVKSCTPGEEMVYEIVEEIKEDSIEVALSSSDPNRPFARIRSGLIATLSKFSGKETNRAIFNASADSVTISNVSKCKTYVLEVHNLAHAKYNGAIKLIKSYPGGKPSPPVRIWSTAVHNGSTVNWEIDASEKPKLTKALLQLVDESNETYDKYLEPDQPDFFVNEGKWTIARYSIKNDCGWSESRETRIVFPLPVPESADDDE